MNVTVKAGPHIICTVDSSSVPRCGDFIFDETLAPWKVIEVAYRVHSVPGAESPAMSAECRVINERPVWIR